MDFFHLKFIYDNGRILKKIFLKIARIYFFLKRGRRQTWSHVAQYQNDLSLSTFLIYDMFL